MISAIYFRLRHGLGPCDNGAHRGKHLNEL